MSRFATLITCSLFVPIALGTLWVNIELIGTPSPPERPKNSMGHGFRVERGTQHIVHLSGDPYALGFYNARLLAPLMERQEHLLFDLMFRFAPSPWAAMAVRKFGLFYLTGIDTHLLEREKIEILGLADGGPDVFPEMGPRYGRITAYHAAHELSHRFAFDSPFAQDPWGCSMIAIGKSLGDLGHAYLARNFDFEGGDVFDRDKVVAVMRPRVGYGFVSVSWSGMAGVVSGMNEHGLSIVLNAGASGDYRRIGTPTTFLVRRALEGAKTVDEAVAILTQSHPFITDIIGIADAQGQIAVLELTPKRYGLRRGPWLIATNHLESAALSHDAVSQSRLVNTTTGMRHRRLEQLVQQYEGDTKIGPKQLLHMLRDRRALGGRLLPLGHRHAIDAVIAAHSVIFDATAKRIWVSVGPHTAGPYYAYDVPALIAANNADNIRAAYLPSFEASDMIKHVPSIKAARLATQRARHALREGDVDGADAALSQSSSMEQHPNRLQLRGEIALARGDPLGAARLFQAALDAPPEYVFQKNKLRRLLASTIPKHKPHKN